MTLISPRRSPSLISITDSPIPTPPVLSLPQSPNHSPLISITDSPMVAMKKKIYKKSKKMFGGLREKH